MAATEQPRPSLIASHVDVIYRVYGARKVGTVTGAPGNARLTRLLRGRGTSIGSVRKVHAVKDVSFVAHHGESIGIIGRNGSGKSTLLRALAGLIPPSHGEIYTAGRPALLGVNAVLMRNLSGERNVMIGGQALGLTAKEVREKMDDIVSFAGVEDYIDLPMKAYSSGMAARLRFAISTAAVPDILMIDEALSTGDAEFQVRSKERVTQIREDAGTVFLVSHSDSTVRSMCDRALWLEGGRLVLDGPVDEVCDAYQREREKSASKKKKAAGRKAAAQESGPDQPAGKKPAQEKPAAKEPAPEKTAPEKPAKPAPGKPAVEKPAADQPKKPAPEEPAAERSGPEKPGPEKSAKAAPQKPAGESPAPEKAGSNKAVPEKLAKPAPEQPPAEKPEPEKPAGSTAMPAEGGSMPQGGATR